MSEQPYDVSKLGKFIVNRADPEYTKITNHHYKWLIGRIATLEADNARLTAERDAMAKHAFSELNQNVGHGHVYPRPDGNRMRCGGPRMCPDCARDFAALEALRDKLKGTA